MNNEILFDELNKLIDEGDEQKVVDFIKKNINYFSSSVKKDFLFSMLENSLINKENENKGIKELQDDLIEKENFLLKYKKILTDAEKIATIQDGL